MGDIVDSRKSPEMQASAAAGPEVDENENPFIDGKLTGFFA